MPGKRLSNFRNETYKDFSLPKEKITRKINYFLIPKTLKELSHKAQPRRILDCEQRANKANHR